MSKLRRTVHHDAVECPGCQNELNASRVRGTTVTTGKPNPGDMTICVDCGLALVFGEGLALRPATDDEVTAVGPAFVAQVKQLQHYARHGVKPIEAMPKPGRNDPCPCESGEKFKRCHGDVKKLEVWLFDHPDLGDLWDTEAIDEETARANFEEHWRQRVQAGLLPENHGLFELGKVYTEDESASEP